MQIEALRTALVRKAYHCGAPEPEDAAQTILLKALRSNGLEMPERYWWRAARNEASNQRRRVVPEDIAEYWGLGYEQEWPDIDLRRALAGMLPEIRALVEYDGRRSLGATERVRIMRLRRKVRERLACASAAGV